MGDTSADGLQGAILRLDDGLGRKGRRSRPVAGSRWRGDRGGVAVPVAMPIQTDWVQSVLFDRGYLARIRGEAIKVYW